MSGNISSQEKTHLISPPICSTKTTIPSTWIPTCTAIQLIPSLELEKIHTRVDPLFTLSLTVPKIKGRQPDRLWTLVKWRKEWPTLRKNNGTTSLYSSTVKANLFYWAETTRISLHKSPQLGCNPHLLQCKNSSRRSSRTKLQMIYPRGLTSFGTVVTFTSKSSTKAYKSTRRAYTISPHRLCPTTLQVNATTAELS